MLQRNIFSGAIMRLDAIPIGENPPDDINVIVEVPVGGEPIKYEMDKASGTLFVDRFLYTPMRYPGNYGFVPHTLSEDGDPIDVLIANQRPIVPGAVMSCRPGRTKKSWPFQPVSSPGDTKRFRPIAICRTSLLSRCSISSSITKILSPGNG